MLFSVKRVLFFLFFVTAMLLVPNGAKRLTQGFRIAKLQLDFPFHPEWEIPPNSAFHEILQQNYTYLSKGAQSYVFESSDGRYVVKLFRFDHDDLEDKVTFLFNACKLAYDHLPEETGLLYIHLNATPMGLPMLHCKDAVGRSYQFDLNQTRFVLQRKAQNFRKTLQESLGEPVAMQKRLDEFIELLYARTDKWILNTDPNLSRNFGFLEDRAIEFDFGNYRYVYGLDKRAEIERYSQRMRNWLTNNAPEWLDYFNQRLERR
jgi:hypothetical protein